MKKLVILVGFFLYLIPIGISAQSISAGNDTTICLGGTATLSATVVSGSYGTDSYSFENIPYLPEAYFGGTPIDPDFRNCPNGTPTTNHDDTWAGPYNIGFDFCFFNVTYTQFWVGSNGWIGFSDPMGQSWCTYFAQNLPSAAATAPKNCIFSPWQDWYPTYFNNNNVFYYQAGTAPNRKLVVYWAQCPMYGCVSGPVPRPEGTFQIVIHEQSSIIENHITKKDSCSWGSNKASQGVQNITGTVAFTATGRNNSSWTAYNESTRFVPSGTKWYTGGYPMGTIVGYGNTINVTPTVTTTYTAVVELCDQTVATDDVIVTVLDPTFSYSAGSYCQSDPDPTPTITQPGGMFTANPPGMVFLSTTTGTIDLSASATGTYSVKYTTSPVTCMQSHNVSVIPTPAAPTAITPLVTRCGPGNVTFSVVENPGETIRWFDAPVGGTQYPFTGGTITTPVVASTHFYAEAVTNGSNCYSLTRTDITVTVNPIPLVTNTTMTFTICSGDTAKIYPQSSVAGSTFSWTATGSSPNVSGYSSGSGLSIIQKLLNSGTTFETVTYAVTAIANGCTSPAVNFVVTVRPFYTGTATPPSQTICSATATSIVLSSNPAGATFNWTASCPSPNVTGYSAGSGTSITQTITNTGNTDEIVTYKAFPVTTGCIGDTVVIPVTVKRYPDLTNNPLAKQICNNTATNITLTSSVPGTLFTWTCTPSSPNVTGYSNNAVPTTLLNQTLLNSGFAIETVVYHIIPHAGGCDGVVTNYTVTVYPVANVIFTPPSQSICSALSCNISITSSAGGATFTWTATGSGPSITGFSAGSGNLISQALSNSGYTPGTVTYTATATANSCPGSSSAVIVTVRPVPTVTFTQCFDPVTITTAKPITLKGGIPLGGTYSGPGVAAGIFNPALAGTGTKTFTYSFTNTFNCPATAQQSIIVQNPPAFVCGGVLTDVRDSKQYSTILIGAQCWMAANLDYGGQIPGPTVQTDNCIIEKYCYNNAAAKCTSSGGLYQWDELVQYAPAAGIQGLCPPGWHIPVEAEWNTLFNNYINNGFAGNPLKITGYSGFNAQLCGVWFFNRSWQFDTWATFFWSSTASGISKTWAHAMNDPDPSVAAYPASRANAFSVRCLKD